MSRFRTPSDRRRGDFRKSSGLVQDRLRPRIRAQWGVHFCGKFGRLCWRVGKCRGGGEWAVLLVMLMARPGRRCAGWSSRPTFQLVLLTTSVDRCCSFSAIAGAGCGQYGLAAISVLGRDLKFPAPPVRKRSMDRGRMRSLASVQIQTRPSFNPSTLPLPLPLPLFTLISPPTILRTPRPPSFLTRQP